MIETHRFVTPQDKSFPEDRFCEICGEYTTHPNHEHAKECTCPRCKTIESLNKVKSGLSTKEKEG